MRHPRDLKLKRPKGVCFTFWNGGHCAHPKCNWLHLREQPYNYCLDLAFPTRKCNNPNCALLQEVYDPDRGASNLQQEKSISF